MVADNQSVDLRKNADHCRWLAKAVSDRQTIDALRQTARDFDAEAERMEAEESAP